MSTKWFGFRDDMPALFQNVPTTRWFMWQQSMVFTLKNVQGAVRMVRGRRSFSIYSK